ncbi:peptidase C45 [Candidatus Bathyarchaeota archaeon]|nr:peptidase C45 [Candidatus Bathyarchaeota archaeon]
MKPNLLGDKEIQHLLMNSHRLDVNGWIKIHLCGSPFQVGFQHGYWLANEIASNIKRTRLYVEKIYEKPWSYFLTTAEKICWDKTPDEYKEEIHGILTGLNSRGFNYITLNDILFINGYGDVLSYHTSKECKGNEQNKNKRREPHCSAFIATGNATEDGKIILAHNTWFSYIIGVGYNVIMDITPEKGHKMLFQTWPGAIGGSTIDWDINDAGLIIAETTITGATKFNPEGTPYFVRCRKALQYSDSIDEWINIMITKNNGGWANDYLIGDVKTNEIGWLELGAFKWATERKINGYFIGSNIAINNEVRQETTFDYTNLNKSPLARYYRLKQLMEEYQGRLNVDAAKKIISDHFDITQNKENPSACSICGHVEFDPRGFLEWRCNPFEPFGAVDAKVTASELAIKGSMWAHWGPACEIPFKAKEFLKQHSEFKWQENYLEDIIPYPWTLFSIKWR